VGSVLTTVENPASRVVAFGLGLDRRQQSAWDGVSRRLEELGHIAHAPTLPGHGPHVATGAGYQEAGDAVARYIAECDLHDIVLVGHSGGGVAISKAVELIADRVERFVYVNGWVLKDSEFILGLVPPHYRELFASMAAESPNNTVEVPFEIWRSSFINDADYAAAKSAFAQLVPEPFSYLVELVNLTIFHSLTIPKSYILPTEDIALPRDRAWGWHPRMTNRLGDHRFLEMPGSHEVMFTNPRLQSCSHAGLPVGQRGRNLRNQAIPPAAVRRNEASVRPIRRADSARLQWGCRGHLFQRRCGQCRAPHPPEHSPRCSPASRSFPNRPASLATSRRSG
jgi:pimeloyl-ACP methyl ester carboxylesterase